MTNIYIYCLFDRNDVLHGVYSSVEAVHRDAVKLSVRLGVGKDILMEIGDTKQPANAKSLRNLLRGCFDVRVQYYTSRFVSAKIVKTKLKE